MPKLGAPLNANGHAITGLPAPAAAADAASKSYVDARIAPPVVAPVRLMVFGHSGSTGFGLTDAVNNRATARLGHHFPHRQALGEYNNGADGMVIRYDGIQSPRTPTSPGVKGWPRVYATSPFTSMRVKPITPDRPGMILFWTASADLLVASADATWKQTMRALACRVRCHYYNENHGTTATTGTWTITSNTAGNGASGDSYLAGSVGATRQYVMATGTAQPFAGRWINVGWIISGTGTQTATVRTRVDGGAWQTDTISTWAGNMLPAVQRVQQSVAQAATIDIEVVSKDAGATVGVDWIGVEAKYPPLVCIVEAQAGLPTAGYTAVASAGWPNASTFQANPATVAAGYNTLLDDIVTEFLGTDGVQRVVRLPINSLLDPTDASFYQSDSIHFNEIGHAVLASGWLKTLFPLMRPEYEMLNNTTGTG